MTRTDYVEFVAPPYADHYIAFVQLGSPEAPAVRVRRQPRQTPWRCDECGPRPENDPCPHATAAHRGQRQYQTQQNTTERA